jgi:hypothetical protein
MALQYVADANLQTVTLGSNYTLGDTSMVLTTGQGARLPSSGDFWIMTPDTAPPNRIIWKVTARSSDTLTVVYDNSYGADANLTTGTRLMWSLTAEALTQLKTDVIGMFGTFANLPSATIGVVRYDFTNSYYSHAVSDGTDWHYFFPGLGEASRPKLADFTWINQGAATADDTYGYITIEAPANSADSMRMLVRSVPATPWTLTMGFTSLAVGVDAPKLGACYRESATQKVVTVACRVAQQIGMARYTNATTYAGSNEVDFYIIYAAQNAPLFLRLSDNGTNRVTSRSTDGRHWTVIGTISRTDFLTADQVGVFVNPASATYPAKIHLFHWKME